MDGSYVLLHYNYDGAVAPMPKNILFVIKIPPPGQPLQYAPWYAYWSSNKVTNARVNPRGGIAFLESPPTGMPNGPDNLFYCAQETNPTALNSQFTAYQCAGNPAAAVQVDQILWNQVYPLIGAQAPDGKFYGLDWIDDRLVYTRSSISGGQATLNLWDSLLQTNTVIDSVFYSQWTQNDMWLNSVDRTGAIGYQILNFAGLLSGGVSIEYRGAYPQSPGVLTSYVTLGSTTWSPYFYREVQSGTGLFSMASSNFVRMGTEHLGFFRLRPVAATPTTPAIELGDLYARTSNDNFQQDYLVAQAPNPNATLVRPKRTHFPTHGEGLAAISSTNGLARIEYYLYQPQPSVAGVYIHIQTIDPVLNSNLALLAVSDEPSTAAILGMDYTSTYNDGTVVLIQCQ